MVVRLHCWNAMLIGLFLALHLISHLWGIGGASSHQQALEVVRPVYRSRFVEPGLLLSILAQIVLGTVLAMRRAPSNTEWGWGRLQIVSGVYLAFFMTVHVTSALVTRNILGLDTNFWWPASTLDHRILRLFFYPYYFFAIVALFCHAAAAAHFRGYSSKACWWLIALGCTFSIVLLAIFGSWITDARIPTEYLEPLNRIIQA